MNCMLYQLLPREIIMETKEKIEKLINENDVLFVYERYSGKLNSKRFKKLKNFIVYLIS